MIDRRQHSSGIALIITLLVIVILTIAVTAFMQSMSMERRTSQAYLNILRAQEAAEAAQQSALNSIAKLRTKPASAIYEKGAASPDAPYLYLATAALSPIPPAVPTTRVTTGDALFSTAQTQPAILPPGVTPVPIATQLSVTDLNTGGSSITRTVTSASSVSVNLNQKSFIGLQNSSASDLSIPVNWKYLRGTTGKVVSRFAYWCEDESSKLDLLTAGNNNGPTQIHKRNQGETLDDISLHVLSKLTAGFTPANVQNILAFRASAMGKLDFTSANFRYPFAPFPNATINDADWKLIQPYVTIYSNNDDRTPDGKKKLNLNTLAQSPDRLGAIKAMRAVIEANLPDFGSRYYRYNNHTAVSSYDPTPPASVAVTADDKKDYLTKICVNILDFIDSDHNPTAIVGRESSGNEHLLTGRPTLTFGAENIPFLNPDPVKLPVAVGKESTALLSEYVLMARQVVPADDKDPGGGTVKDVTFRLSHYIELRNLTAKTLSVAGGDFGTRPFIQIGGRTTWTNTLSPLTVVRPADIEIRLPSNLTIPPNGYAVLSTDLHIPSSQDPIPSTSNTYDIPREPYNPVEANRTPGTWSEADDIASNGWTPMSNPDDENYTVDARRGKSGSGQSLKHIWEINSEGATGEYAAAKARIILGNATSLLDCMVTVCDTQSIGVPRQGDEAPSITPTMPFDPKSTSSYNNGVATGSGPRYGRGDPRANLEVRSNASDGRRITKASGAVYKDFTYVTLGGSNYNYLDGETVTTWNTTMPEFTPEARGNLWTIDGTIKSLGQLGQIYDPACVDKTYRSSWRTLRMGQSDASTNNRAYSSSWNNRIWTGGFGSDDPADAAYDRNAFLLPDLFRVDDLTGGKINVNGIMRGSTVVLDALLDQYVFNNTATAGALQGSDNISNTNLAATNGIKNLATAVASELSSNKPFLSTGDISRLAIFGTNLTGATDKLAELTIGSMHDVSDTGREEFFRRTASLMTVNPLSFTIYCVGQSGAFVSDSSNVFRVNATNYVKTTVTLTPVYPTFPDNVTGAPTSWKISIRNRNSQ